MDFVSDAIEAETGRQPKLSTTGGTSDARFIVKHCPVVEFGLVGQTMHQVDERVPVADLERLAAIYRRILNTYFAADWPPELGSYCARNDRCAIRLARRNLAVTEIAHDA